jgi:hypothetical protein
VNGLSPAEWLPLLLIAVAAATYIVREGLELTGRSPGAELLRIENGDLVRRNRELEESEARREQKISDLELEVADLKLKVRDLEMTNQAAVLVALKEHEKGAKERHGENQALLQRAVDALEGRTA